MAQMPVGGIDFPWTVPNAEPIHLSPKPKDGHLEAL